MPGSLANVPRLDALRAMARTAAVAAGATLLAFHGCLFAAQAVEGRLEDPWLAFRWLMAAGLVAVLGVMRRAGGSIWTRQGLLVWVVAALLHGPAVTTDFANPINLLAPPQTVAAAFLESLVSITALAVTVWMLAGLLAWRNRHARLYARAVTPRRATVLGDGFSPRYSSRPPPPRR